MPEDENHELFGGVVPIALFAKARYSFKASERNELLGILADELGISARDKRSQALLDALEIEIGRHGLFIKANKSKPTDAAVQKQFKQLPQKARTFQKALEDMCPDARSLVLMTLQERMGLFRASASIRKGQWQSELEAIKASHQVAEDFLGNLTKNLQFLHSALLMAQEVYESDADNTKHPGHGRRHTLRLMLATNVAWAYYKHVGKVPKKTRTGPFYSILRICLQAADFYRQDYFDVMKEAIDSMWEV